MDNDRMIIIKKVCFIYFICFIFSPSFINATDSSLCGPLSISIITQKFSIRTSMNEICTLSGYDPNQGTTLLGLYAASKKLGLPVIPVKLTNNQFSLLSNPAILLVDDNHFLVVHGTKWFGKFVIVQDPPKEKEVVRRDIILKRWKGEALLFSEKIKKELSQENKKNQSINIGPHIEIEQNTLFLGTVVKNEQVKGIFSFMNTGTDTLKVNARPSCGCIVSRINKPIIPPGEAGEIEVVFDTSGRSGHQKQSITLITNDPENKYINLTVAMTVREKAIEIK